MLFQYQRENEGVLEYESIYYKDYLLCCLQEGTTPLILAAANNHVECVKELLKNGGDGAARRLVSYD
mgnify:CR=1 FL=1